MTQSSEKKATILFREAATGWTVPDWHGFKTQKMIKNDEALQLDLANGSVVAMQDAGGNYWFIQNDNIHITSNNHAIIRQSNPAVKTDNTISILNGAIKLTIVDLNIESVNVPISIKGRLTINHLGTCTLVSKNSSGILLDGNDSSLIICGIGIIIQ